MEASAASARAARLAGLVDDVTQDAQLAAAVRFVAELDALRTVERRSYVDGGTRAENSAEHSWHVATMALVFAPALGPVDIDRVVQMLLVHDLVEIDAGDVAVYDTAARAAKATEELAAADRLYGILPIGTGRTLRALWDEYEARATPEARAAAALDRLAPLLLNWLSGGRTWREIGVTEAMARAVNEPVAAAASVELLAVVRAVIDDAARRGWFAHT